MCGWKGIERICGGGHIINGSSTIIENKYTTNTIVTGRNVPAVSLYCNSIGHVNDVLASSIQNEGLSNETRELKTHEELYDTLPIFASYKIKRVNYLN